MRNRFVLSACLLLMALLSACVSHKQILSFQPDAEGVDAPSVSDTNYIAIIHPGDQLNIYVSSTSPEASKYFNFSEREDANSLANVYLVDERGMVRLPLIGDLRVAGYTSSAARDTFTRRLEKYLVNPAVKLNIRNFRVSVMGEVLHPGVYTVSNERITLPEALAMAGDMTIYSSRNNVLIIREEGGKKNYMYVDLSSRELFSSPCYFLHANDVVYVEPLATKKSLAENWYRTLPIVFSGLSLMLAVWATIR